MSANAEYIGSDGQHERSTSAPGSPAQLEYLLAQGGLTPNLIDQWGSSAERTWYIERRPFILRWTAAGIVLVLIAAAITSTTLDGTIWTEERFWAAISLTAGLIILGYSAVPYWTSHRAFTQRRRARAKYSVDKALVELRETMMTEGPGSQKQLARMFELNRKQLDEYLQLTISQQRASFALTWGAAIAALLILVIGSILALHIGDPDRYIAGGLTALGTLLSAFLGTVFFRGHEAAVDQLNRYYQEPSVTGRLLAAERLMGSLKEEERAEMASKILARILLPDSPPSSTAEGEDPKGEPKPETTKAP